MIRRALWCGDYLYGTFDVPVDSESELGDLYIEYLREEANYYKGGKERPYPNFPRFLIQEHGAVLCHGSKSDLSQSTNPDDHWWHIKKPKKYCPAFQSDKVELKDAQADP